MLMLGLVFHMCLLLRPTAAKIGKYTYHLYPSVFTYSGEQGIDNIALVSGLLLTLEPYNMVSQQEIVFYELC
jgi:hypothetical protein